MLRRVFLVLGFSITATGWVFAAIFYLHPTLSIGNSHDLEYKDFISMLLTALGVLIAVMATTFAIAAIWGYGALRKRSLRRVRQKPEVRPKRKLGLRRKR